MADVRNGYVDAFALDPSKKDSDTISVRFSLNKKALKDLLLIKEHYHYGTLSVTVAKTLSKRAASIIANEEASIEASSGKARAEIPPSKIDQGNILQVRDLT